jgi:hypothetical protein
MTTNYWFPRILTKEDERDYIRDVQTPRYISGDIGVVETQNNTLLQATLSKMNSRTNFCSTESGRLVRGKPKFAIVLDSAQGFAANP